MVQVQETNSYFTTFFLHITLFYVTDLCGYNPASSLPV